MFARSLAAGTSDAYFPLSEQFMTQGVAAVARLTSRRDGAQRDEHRPEPAVEGRWRWFSEEMLLGNRCKPASEVEEDGMTMDDVAAVARCHGTAVEVRATDVSLDAFREQVVASVASPAPPYLVATFSRSVLGQTGDGHFSPIAGYDAQSDHVLVLDVARFKYPPWCTRRRCCTRRCCPTTPSRSGRAASSASPPPRPRAPRSARSATSPPTAAAGAVPPSRRSARSTACRWRCPRRGAALERLRADARAASRGGAGAQREGRVI